MRHEELKELEYGLGFDEDAERWEKNKKRLQKLIDIGFFDDGEFYQPLTIDKAALGQQMDEVLEEIGGTVMSPHEVADFIIRNQSVMRDAYKVFDEILTIGFGMNDGDTDCTIAAEWSR
jgi:hypothetical protein